MKNKTDKKTVRIQETHYSPAQIIGRKIQRLIWLVSSVVQGIIFLKIILLLVDANPNNMFAGFIFEASAFLLSPFNNLVNNITISGATFDLTALIAILVYGLVAWLLTELVWVVFSPSTKKQQVIYEE